MNDIKKNIIERGLKTHSKIILPEISDSRIQEASKELISIGYDIVSLEDYQDNYDEYLEMLSKMKFCKNWPYEEIKKYGTLQNVSSSSGNIKKMKSRQTPAK